MMTPLRLLCLAALCLTAPLAAAAQAGPSLTAQPSEYGLAPLDFRNSPNAPTPTPMRDWQMPDGSTLRASLINIVGLGRVQAAATLLTPEGRKLHLALADMQPQDVQVIDPWIYSQGFVNIEAYGPNGPGMLCARVLEVSKSRTSTSFPMIDVLMQSPDGNIYAYGCNAVPITEREVKSHSQLQLGERVCLFLTEKGLKTLHENYAQEKAKPRPKPILMASSPAEARAYASLYGLTVVTIYLNRRGSECALAWKRYLERYPEAGSYWNHRYVFVGVHCADDGSYPADLLNEMRITVPYGKGDQIPYAALLSGESHREGAPRFLSTPQPARGCYTIADFLATPPADITFDF